ncbi:MAG: ATPase, T2SS/T4P/T4SS family [Halobacteriaceae archaeon]
MLERVWTTSACGCEPSVDDGRLCVDASDCPGDGDLVREAPCRRTAIGVLRDRDADPVLVRSDGVERLYDGRAAALLVAAGRFADRTGDLDERLADRALGDPLAAVREVAGRAGPVADAADACGLLDAAEGADSYGDVLTPLVRPTVARSRIDPTPPADATIDDRRDSAGGTRAIVYDCPGAELRRYHLQPAELSLGDSALATLDAAHALLADGAVPAGDRGPRRAVERAGADPADVDALAGVLEKHTSGFGVVEDLFSDPAVTDAYVPAPAASNRVRVRLDDEVMRTNVTLTAEGGATLASRLRRASGRPLSRASPALDAVADDVGVAERLRAAAVRAPLSDGEGFALRAHGADPFTLPGLVANGTLSAETAGLLSVAVERGAALLVTGARGAGKTTLLEALLVGLRAADRLVVIEDSPELPVSALQAAGRDVQRLNADPAGDPSPTDALRTALRLGDGAIAIGEVRGEEAQVLYEAMRVGANGGAVLGTIHGNSAAAVRERVVTDLGVSPSSFAATDAVVTVERTSVDGPTRRVSAVDEVVDHADAAPTLATRDGLTDRAHRGNSDWLATLAGPDETYGDTLAAVADRADTLSELAAADCTALGRVVEMHAERRSAAA